MDLALTIAQGLLVAVFLMAGGALLTRSDDMVEAFDRYGYSDAFMLFVGACEVMGALGLLAGFWWPNLAALAGAGLAVIMTGAAWTHLRVGDPAWRPLLPLALGGLAAWTAVANGSAVL
jgi:hypothetical protein